MKNNLSSYWRVILIVYGISLLLILVTFITPFCDWYKLHIYPPIADAFGHLTENVPFIIAEWLILIDIVLVIISTVLLVMLIFLRKRRSYRDFTRHWFKTLLMICGFFLLSETAVYLIPFRASVLLESDRSGKRTEYSYYDLAAVMKYVVETGNQAAEEMQLNEESKAIFLTDTEMHDAVTRALNDISGDYQLLEGYYPHMKYSGFSDIIDRMNIGGISFPLTGEAMHNRYTSPIYRPVLDAHELSHHKGYFLENEANFLAYIACLSSDEPQLRMSAAREIHDILSEPFSEAQEVIKEEKIASGELPEFHLTHATTREEFEAYIDICTRIFGDFDVDFSERFWQICDNSSVILQETYDADDHPMDDMPLVDEVIHGTADIGWDIEKRILKENYYDGDLLLILQYFDGKLY